jgi:acetyl-CoA acetyltransferase
VIGHRFEHDVVISGVGQSPIGRRLGRSDLDLTIESTLSAMADAGLERADIDGLSTYPGGYGPPSRGYGGPSTYDMQDALRLDLNWFQGAAELPGQLGALVAAAMAVSAGLARHVLVYRTVTESTAQGHQSRSAVFDSSGVASGIGRWITPYGAPSAVNWLALVAARHFYEHGTTREQLAQIALTARANAALNPAAVYRHPLTMDDYLSSRMISTPFCLYDCDVPVDGSTAIIVSHVDYARDLPGPPVYLDAIGTAARGRLSWDQYDDLSSMAAQGAAEHLWSRTTLKPADVDMIQLYDGFSMLALVWLEALGFCRPGEGGAFIEGGHRIARDGELPLNTFGGQLSAGRLHGFGHLHEAIVQLRGGSGERQVADARVAAVGNGGGPIAGCALLTAEPVS